MPMHDWTTVPDGIVHVFHHGWVSALCDALNASTFTPNLYALPERVADDSSDVAKAPSEAEFYRRKKSAIAIRHVSGDRVVAMIEIVSPGNKASKNGVRAFVNNACELLEARSHLLIVDPFPPGPRDPGGVHGLIWDEVTDTEFRPPADKPFTLVAYESDLITRAYVQNIAVGDALPDMELFLEPNGCVMVPLEATYTAAFDVQPRRWRDVLQPPRR
ncbi:DUF4058 family protein [Frigoriglobus tundricola]|uniref:DUF4058 domain-containing protein n=1 Tax=Frigoriglobus tundricola TaxID=2774151 RepID=A0A6M5YGM8_9BACT|nr:DUF4058 family protein [Frigoriglobus tundricola]QJW92744.1 hypothetical protein FTUN_0241 [Frigoriglobus tundricola]